MGRSATFCWGQNERLNVNMLWTWSPAYMEEWNTIFNSFLFPKQKWVFYTHDSPKRTYAWENILSLECVRMEGSVPPFQSETSAQDRLLLPSIPPASWVYSLNLFPGPSDLLWWFLVPRVKSQLPIVAARTRHSAWPSALQLLPTTGLMKSPCLTSATAGCSSSPISTSSSCHITFPRKPS